MPRSVNKATIIGNLGQAPELRYTDGGTAVCNMRVATNESYTRDDGETVQRTEWHTVVAWERLAEVCEEHLEKGSQVYVEGPLETREWEDRDGNTRRTTQIKAREVVFLGRDGQMSSEAPADQRRGGGEDLDQSHPETQSTGPDRPDGGKQNFEPDDQLPF